MIFIKRARGRVFKRGSGPMSIIQQSRLSPKRACLLHIRACIWVCILQASGHLFASERASLDESSQTWVTRQQATHTFDTVDVESIERKNKPPKDQTVYTWSTTISATNVTVCQCYHNITPQESYTNRLEDSAIQIFSVPLNEAGRPSSLLIPEYNLTRSTLTC